MNQGFYHIDSEAGAWNTGSEDNNRGYKVRYKGGYFPVAPYDHFGELRDEMTIELEKAGLIVERAHHEVGTAGQAEINYRFDTLLRAADDVMKFKYIIKNVAWRNGKTATFMPKPIFGDNGSGMHCHQSIWNKGEPLFYDETGYAGLSDMARYYIGGLLKHAPSLLAFTNPTVNSYHRLVPGFEAPVNLVYSQRNRSACVRIPITGSNPKAKRIEFRCPDPSANPYLAFSAMLLAGIDGIKNKIEPHEPVDKDLYELPPDEHANIPTVPGLAVGGHRLARGRPRLPPRGRRVHPRPDRDLDRLQADQRDPADRSCARTRTSSSSTTTSNRASGCGRSATPNNRYEQPLTCTNAVERPSGRSAAFAVASGSSVTNLVQMLEPRASDGPHPQASRCSSLLRPHPGTVARRSNFVAAARYATAYSVSVSARAPSTSSGCDSSASRRIRPSDLIAPGSLSDIGVRRPNVRHCREEGLNDGEELEHLGGGTGGLWTAATEQQRQRLAQAGRCARVCGTSTMLPTTSA